MGIDNQRTMRKEHGQGLGSKGSVKKGLNKRWVASGDSSQVSPAETKQEELNVSQRLSFDTKRDADLCSDIVKSECSRHEKELNDYFKQFDNADMIRCGCGCNAMLAIPHGILQRVHKDLKRVFGGEKKWVA